MSINWETREEAEYLTNHAEWMRGVAERQLKRQAERKRDQFRAGLVLLTAIGLVALLFWRGV